MNTDLYDDEYWCEPEDIDIFQIESDEEPQDVDRWHIAHDCNGFSFVSDNGYRLLLDGSKMKLTDEELARTKILS